MPVKLFIVERYFDSEGEDFKRVIVNAEMLDRKYFGLSFFIHKSLAGDDREWSISEFETGAMVAEGDTIPEAEMQLENRVAEYGKEEWLKRLAGIKENYGIINHELPQPTL